MRWVNCDLMCCREVGSKERGINSSTKYAIEERNLQSSYILSIFYFYSNIVDRIIFCCHFVKIKNVAVYI